MFELLQAAARPKRTFLSWLGAACVLSGACVMLSAKSYSLSAMPFIIAGNILVTVDARQKKEPQLPHLLPQ
jgi:hypothetical protein